MRSLSIIALMTLLCNTSTAQNFKVCMGNGGGPSCIMENTLNYTCDQYRAIGGGGLETKRALQARLCPNRLANITVKSDVAGGECGWTLFEVECLNSK